MSQPAALAPRFLADVVPGARVRDAALVLTGTTVIAALSQVAIPLPFTPVPLSLATFAVLLTGAALGTRRGLAAAGLYLALGVVGVPVFAGASSGWAFASFGYVVGFVVATAVVGRLARGQADRSVGGTVLLAVAGNLAIYACGVPWLMLFLQVDLMTALGMAVVPFLIGDAIKIAAMALVLPGTWRLVQRRR